MSIKTTRYITREEAIERISDILVAIVDNEYNYIEENSFESDYEVDLFIYDHQFDERSWLLYKWTDEMLEEYMDRPFFRYSMFDNYIIRK